MFRDKRVVVKIGTTSLTHETGQLNFRKAEALVKILSDIKNSGAQLVVVSSGAIAVGVGKLGLDERPCDTPSKQACAAVGQCELMYFYDKAFGRYNHTVAQLLITRDVVEKETSKQNVINTLDRIMEMDIIPIINENDTVATEEVEFGDNDTLSAIVAKISGADLLILISDIDGLFDKNPKLHSDAKLISEVTEITPEIRALADGTSSGRGTGGMVTKLDAAQIATDAGIDMIIINGEYPENLYRINDGISVGTLFRGKK